MRCEFAGISALGLRTFPAKMLKSSEKQRVFTMKRMAVYVGDDFVHYAYNVYRSIRIWFRVYMSQEKCAIMDEFHHVVSFKLLEKR